MRPTTVQKEIMMKWPVTTELAVYVYVYYLWSRRHGGQTGRASSGRRKWGSRLGKAISTKEG